MKNHPIPKATAITLLQQRAADARRQRDFRTNFELLREAHLLSPKDPGLLLDLGTAYGRLTQFPEAVEYFDRAVDESRDKSRVLSSIGFLCRGLLRPDLSAHYLGRAAAEPGVSAEILAQLAEVKERLRETADAKAAVERALTIDSKCPLALLIQARLARGAGQLDEAEKILLSFLPRTDRAGWPIRIRGWHELAILLDRQGRYDEAIQALTTAKNFLIPNSAGDVAARKAAHRSMHQTTSELTVDHFTRWGTSASDSDGRRLALIAGHPRSGTTLLEQVLDSHSGVVSAEETTLFLETYCDLERNRSPAMAPMLDSLPSDAIREARENYFRRMDLFVSATSHDRMLIDKNPSLTGLIPGLLRVIPQAKIIVALRDPRDVCLSCFFQYLGAGPIGSMFLTLEGVVEEYCALMNFWLAIKPLLPTPVLEIRYEDFVKDMPSEAERTLRFLGLDWEPAMLNFHEHAGKKLIRSPTYSDVARPISSGAIGRWKHYRKHLEPHLAQLAPLVKAFGYEAD